MSVAHHLSQLGRSGPMLGQLHGVGSGIGGVPFFSRFARRPADPEGAG